MARKKQMTSHSGSAPWLNTFADLMNLLLCFFVMLFAFSDVNPEKFEQMSVSMSKSIGITNKSTTGINTKAQISTGMSQITGLEDYYSDLTEEEEKAAVSEASDAGDEELNTALETINKKMAKVTAGMYDKVSDLTEQYELKNYVDLTIDPEHRYVELTLKGSILYDSGQAELKKASLPILANIGRILKKFDGCSIEITGYTDNVPVTNSNEFKDNNWLSSARALNAAEYLINECNIDPSVLKYSGRGEYEPIASNATEKGRAKNRRIEIKIYNKYSSK